MAEKIVQIDHVTKKYKERTVLDDVSLSIWTGDIIGLLGGNGAGKTTLMRAIAGSIPVDSGEISFSGERRTQDVGTLIENPNIYTDMSGIENLRYFGRLFGVEDEAVYESLLHQMGLAEAGKKLAGRYSLGMKQRLGIAVAMLGDPRLLILDEPTAGLDPKGRDDILDQIAYLHKQSDMTVILVSHSMEDIARYADRIIVMNKGSVMYNGAAKEVFAHYQELEKIGLAAPQVTYIMHDLKEKGLPVKVNVTTVEEAADEIMQALEKKI